MRQLKWSCLANNHLKWIRSLLKKANWKFTFSRQVILPIYKIWDRFDFEFFTINDLAVSARSGRSKQEFYLFVFVDTWFLKRNVHSWTTLLALFIFIITIYISTHIKRVLLLVIFHKISYQAILFSGVFSVLVTKFIWSYITKTSHEMPVVRIQLRQH